MSPLSALLLAPLTLAAVPPLLPPASASEQVTSISQFSDLQPTDWAYQALSNLVER